MLALIFYVINVRTMTVSTTIEFAAVQKVLQSLEPQFALHNGGIELLAIEGTTVKVRLNGACVGCPLSFMTITFGVEKALKERIHPAVTVIVI